MIHVAVTDLTLKQAWEQEVKKGNVLLPPFLVRFKCSPEQWIEIVELRMVRWGTYFFDREPNGGDMGGMEVIEMKGNI